MSEDEDKSPFGAEPGSVIAGKYRVVQFIAKGGMGAVLKARHEVLEQEVAVKLMRPDLAENREAAQRFLREARAAAKIASDYVARVTDVDLLESGTPFMVMEYLEGEDLAALIDRAAPLPIQQAVDFTMEALAGVDAAHRLGVVHRDLKPSNLFVVGQGSRRRIKVLDFGISKAMDDSASESLKAGATTGLNTMLGTPRYMSPEQVSCAKDVDGRTDIWSIGLILYEALTNDHPFVGDAAQAIFAQILTLPVVSVRDHRSDLPPELERIVLRCLERDRTRRYAKVRDVMRALAPFASERVRLALLDPKELDGSVTAGGDPDETASIRAPGVDRGAATDREQALLPTAAAGTPAAGTRGAGVRRASGRELRAGGNATQASMAIETPRPAAKPRRWALVALVAATVAGLLAVVLWAMLDHVDSGTATAAVSAPARAAAAIVEAGGLPRPAPITAVLTASPSTQPSAPIVTAAAPAPATAATVVATAVAAPGGAPRPQPGSRRAPSTPSGTSGTTSPKSADDILGSRN